jgi:hypothetical protein
MDIRDQMMDVEYEMAVTEQKKELKEYKKKVKSQVQLPQIEPVTLTIEDDISQAQSNRPEGIKA